MTDQPGKTNLATIIRTGLVLPKLPFPGRSWEPRTGAERHLLGQARALDLVRRQLLGEIGRLRQELGEREVRRMHVLTGPTRPLTAQQLEVLAGAATGETLEETASRMCLSFHTVKSHRVRAVKRLGARDMTHAVALAMAAGWIAPESVPLTGGGAP